MSSGDIDAAAFGGARDHERTGASIAERLRRHADALAGSGRSPLYAAVARRAPSAPGPPTRDRRERRPEPARRPLRLPGRGSAARRRRGRRSSSTSRGAGDPCPTRRPARALRVAWRAGCDLEPLDLAEVQDRLTLRSYVWPDELDRLARVDAALEVAARHPPAVASCAAERWLPRVLASRGSGELTAIWQSVMRQYVPVEAWAAIERAEAARVATPDMPLAWLAMEPGEDPLSGFVLSARTWPGGAPRRLAVAADHGPPVRWHAADPRTGDR